MTSSTSAGVDLGALEGGLDGGGAEFMGGDIGESSVERADRGAGGGNDHDIGRHANSSGIGRLTPPMGAIDLATSRLV